MKVKNRHGKVIEGTVYQIALHECDEELIYDVIKPAFERFPNDLEKMEAERHVWFPEGWLEAFVYVSEYLIFSMKIIMHLVEITRCSKTGAALRSFVMRSWKGDKTCQWHVSLFNWRQIII